MAHFSLKCLFDKAVLYLKRKKKYIIGDLKAVLWYGYNAAYYKRSFIYLIVMFGIATELMVS